MFESEDLHNAQTSYRLVVEQVNLAEVQLRRHKRLSILNITTAQSPDAVIAEFDAAEVNLAQGNIDLSLAKAKVATLKHNLHRQILTKPLQHGD